MPSHLVTSTNWTASQNLTRSYTCECWHITYRGENVVWQIRSHFTHTYTGQRPWPSAQFSSPSKHCCKRQNLMILRMLWWPDSTRRTLNCRKTARHWAQVYTGGEFIAFPSHVLHFLAFSYQIIIFCLLLLLFLAPFNELHFIYHNVYYFYSPFSSYSLSPSLHCILHYAYSSPKEF